MEYHDPIFTIELWKALQNIEGIAPQLLDSMKPAESKMELHKSYRMMLDVEGLKDSFFSRHINLQRDFTSTSSFVDMQGHGSGHGLLLCLSSFII